MKRYLFQILSCLLFLSLRTSAAELDLLIPMTKDRMTFIGPTDMVCIFHCDDFGNVTMELNDGLQKYDITLPHPMLPGTFRFAYDGSFFMGIDPSNQLWHFRFDQLILDKNYRGTLIRQWSMGSGEAHLLDTTQNSQFLYYSYVTSTRTSFYSEIFRLNLENFFVESLGKIDRQSIRHGKLNVSQTDLLITNKDPGGDVTYLAQLNLLNRTLTEIMSTPQHQILRPKALGNFVFFITDYAQPKLTLMYWSKDMTRPLEVPLDDSRDVFNYAIAPHGGVSQVTFHDAYGPEIKQYTGVFTSPGQPLTRLTKKLRFGRIPGNTIIYQSDSNHPGGYVASIPTQGMTLTVPALPPQYNPGVFPAAQTVLVENDEFKLPVHVYPPMGNPALSPLLIYIHGGPHSFSDPTYDALWQVLRSRGWTIASVNLRGSLGYGTKFKESIYGNYVEYPQSDLIKVWEILKATPELHLDPRGCYLYGESDGGHKVLRALTHPNVPFLAGISIAGISNWKDDEDSGTDFWRKLFGGSPLSSYDLNKRLSAIENVQNLQAPILLIHGTSDSIVSPDQSTKFYNKASEQKKIVRLALLNTDHFFRERDVEKQAIQSSVIFLTDCLNQGVAAPFQVDNKDQYPTMKLAW